MSESSEMKPVTANGACEAQGDGTTNGNKEGGGGGGGVVEKTEKQLKKEAEKQAKLEKFKAKQQKKTTAAQPAQGLKRSSYHIVDFLLSFCDFAIAVADNLVLRSKLGTACLHKLKSTKRGLFEC